MPGPSRQAVFDASSLITIFWIIIYAAILFWFYNALKKIQKSLEDIKELLKGGKAPGDRSEGQRS
ncbi:MAG: hypothetical protein KGI38_02275 [Thaumarchaeota archaeon]|nr:hypothetical protein [Nitrososphaerota archaeon]